MMKYVTLLLSVLVIIASACTLNTATSPSTPQDAIVCSYPYIRHAESCCLDENSNNICDPDESLPTQPSEVQPPIIEQSPEEVTLELISVSSEKAGPVGMHGNFVRFNLYVNGYARSYLEFCEQKTCKLSLNVEDTDLDVNYVADDNGHDVALYYCNAGTSNQRCIEQIYPNKDELNFNLKLDYDVSSAITHLYAPLTL